MNKRQKEMLQDLIDNKNNQIKKLQQENQELKKYIEKKLYFYSGVQGEDLKIDDAMQYMLDKMQELEKSESNE